MEVFEIAFDAGAVEATLTLNRNPFTAGLQAAKRQAEDFARKRYEVTVRVKVDSVSFSAVKKELEAFCKKACSATAKVVVDRLQFDALVRDLKIFDKRVYSTRVDVDTGHATADVIAFRTLLSTLNDQTVNLNANTRAFGGAAGDGFDQGHSHFARMSALIIATLPIIASGFTAAVGAAGALASAFIIAGLGAGAFALVAVPAFKQIKAAVAGGQAEIDKLPPGLREAANGLKELLGEYDKLVKANQKIVAISLSAWFNAGTEALKSLNPLVVAAANAFGDAGLQAISFFSSPWWNKFVQFLSGAIGPAVDMLFRSLFALIQIVGNLTRAFWDLGGSQIMEMITSGLEKFAQYTERIGQNKTFQEFMEAAQRSLPAVGALLGSLIEFILKLAIGLEPLGTLIVRVLTAIFDALNSMPIPLIQGIAIAIAGVWAAMALGAAAPVAIAIGVLAGLGAIFASVTAEGNTLRDMLEQLPVPIRDWIIPLATQLAEIWDQKVIPAWDRAVAATRDNLIPVFEYLWRQFQENVLPAIKDLALNFTDVLLPAILNFWTAIQPFVAFVVKAFGEDIVYAIQLMINAFDGGFQIVAGLLDTFTGIFTGDWNKFTDGLLLITRGFWTIIAGIFGLSFDELFATFHRWDDNIRLGFRNLWTSIQDGVKAAVDEIGRRWRMIGNLLATPINWVINFVINDGILRAWNTVMSWIGAPSLNAGRVPSIPAFADGGRVRGKGTGTSDENLALVSNDEFVVRAAVARQVMPFLGALNAGQAEAMRAANANSAVDQMMLRFAGGGVVNAQRVANGMVGKPYIWGGAGPGGADCSGLWSIITNAARGVGNPYFRIGSTGTFPWGGFTPGLTSALAIGNSARRGHMAGTLAGTNYEARQTGTPILGGSAAKGADNSYFDAHYSLPQVGGAFVGGGGGVAPVSWWSIIADKVTALFKSLFGGDIPGVGGIIGDAMNNIPRLLVDKVIEAIKSKLEKLMTTVFSTPALDAAGGSNTSLGFGTADRGAVIPPGSSTLFNATGRPEPLTNLDVYERMKPAGLSVEDVLALIEARGGSGSGGDTYNVMLPERASVRELADTLNFKRKVVAKGRYSR